MKRFALLLSATVLMGLLPMDAAAQAANRKVPARAEKAGNITALLPKAKIERRKLKIAESLDAKKGDELFWEDVVKTEKGGRARITLVDQSILSIGSQAQLRIVKHDARSQQTALELAYGRVRAEVASVTRSGGSFQVKTPTAVAGVIGTDFGTTTSIGTTTFLCISGLVSVANADPNVPGQVMCTPGMTTSVTTGNAPTAPAPATPEQIQQLIEDTEPAVISALSPGSGLVGTTFLTSVTGTKLSGVSAVKVSGTGVTATLQPGGSDSSLSIQLAIAADAEPGPRTLTFEKQSGAGGAAVFTVLSPENPNADRQGFLDVLNQQRQTEIASLNAIGVGVQQSADQTGEQISDANQALSPPLNLNDASSALQTEVTGMQEELLAAGTLINEAAAAAAADFNARYDVLTEALKQRVPDGTPDEQFIADVTAAFNEVDAAMLARFAEIHAGLGAQAQDRNTAIAAISQDWLGRIETARNSAPADGGAVTLDLGEEATLRPPSGADSGGSFSWALCRDTSNCTPLFSSNTAEFIFPTCSLAPETYTARLTISNSDGTQSTYHTRVDVLAPSYPAPEEVLRAMAAAFSSLQPDQFLQYFDEQQFRGYANLQENIRRTTDQLSSMSINVVPVTPNISCNSAFLSTQWKQNYTFKDDQSCSTSSDTACQPILFSQQENLEVTFARVPDEGWRVTMLNGTEGNVAGVPPGPIVSDTAAPDLRLTALTSGAGPSITSSLVRAAEITAASNSFAATVTNVGSADLVRPLNVRFSLRRADTSAELMAVEVPLPVPVAANGGTAQVSGTLDFSALPAGVNGRVTATVNPACDPVERQCDGANSAEINIVFGGLDLALSSLTQGGTIFTGATGSATVLVTNVSTVAFDGTSGNIQIVDQDGVSVLGSVPIPALAAGGSATVTVNYTAPAPVATPGSTVTRSVTARFGTSPVGDVNATNNTTASSFIFQTHFVELAISGLTFATGDASLLSQESVSFSFSVLNGGDVASSSGTYVCSLVNGALKITLLTGSFSSVGAAGSQSITTGSGIIPVNQAGANSIECSLATDPQEPPSALANNVALLSVSVSLNVDLEVTSVTPPVAAQMGAAGLVSVSIRNNGPDNAPGGWNYTIDLNSTEFANVQPGPLASGSTTTLGSALMIPSLASPPVDQDYPLAVEVNANAVLPDSDPTNNTFSGTMRLVDFSIGINEPGPLKGVVGRSFSIPNVIGILPNPYPFSPTVSYVGLPPGLTVAGVNGDTITGTPTAFGAPTASVSATAEGVTHSAASGIAFDIANEITLTQVSTLNLTNNGPTQQLEISVSGGVYPVTVTVGTPPSGLTIVGQSSGGTSETLASPGSIFFDVSAVGATAGTNLAFAVTATDGGVAETSTPSGSVTYTVHYNLGGLPNFVITSVDFKKDTGGGIAGPRANPATGTNALQVDEPLLLEVTIANVGSADPAFGAQVSISACDEVGCAEPEIMTVTAPTLGSPVTVLMPIGPQEGPAGSYNGQVIVNYDDALPEDVTEDNTWSEPFEVVDFAITDDDPSFEPQNIAVGGSGELPFTITTDAGNLGPITVSVSAEPDVESLIYGFQSPVTSGGPNVLTVTVPGSATSASMFGVDIQGTNQGVTRHIASTHLVYLYTGTIEHDTAQLGGDSPGNPVKLLKGSGDPTTLHFSLNSDFAVVTSAEIEVEGLPSGVTHTLSDTELLTNTDTFTLSLNADASASVATTSLVTVKVAVPHTKPQAYIQKQFWISPVELQDLAIGAAPTPGGSRDLSTHPWLSGEPLDWNVVVSNDGTAASVGGEQVILLLNGNRVLGTTTLSPIAAGSSQTVSIHTFLPEDIGNGGGLLQAQVFENFHTSITDANNTSTVDDFFTSDWGLDFEGNPVTVTPGGPAVASDSFKLIANTGAPVAGLSVDLALGQVSSRLAPVLSSTSVDSVTPRTVDISASSNAAYGEYFVQVLAQMKDGAAITAIRQITIPVIVGTGVPVDTVQVNVISPTTPNFRNAATPLQINGLLAEQIELEAIRQGGTTGSVDLVFQSGSDLVTPGPYQLTGIAYDIPQFLLVSANSAFDGTITAADDHIFVYANSIQTSAAFTSLTPGPDPQGAPIETFYFQVGDVELSGVPGCIDLGPGANSAVTVGFDLLNGFNVASMDYTWSGLFGGVSVDTPSATGVPFSSLTFNFSNANATDFGIQTFFFNITISNGFGTATKTFPLFFNLNETSCALVDGDFASPAVRTTTSGSQGTWKRGGAPVASASASRTAGKSGAGKLADLRVSVRDIDVSPSVPKNGDTVSVRFRVSNQGGADATAVPIALQVNGLTVASDTFDVAAGKSTLGQIEWRNASLTSPATPTAASGLRRAKGSEGDVLPGRNGKPRITLVIDPEGTLKQQTTQGKSANVVVSFASGGASGDGGPVSAGGQRAILELMEGGCVGFRFSSGAGGMCGNTDVEFTVDEIASGNYQVTANAIADLGAGTTTKAQLASLRYTSQLAAVAGHSYAVQGSNGEVTVFTIRSVRSPGQLDAKAKKIFRGTKVLRKMGGSTEPVEAGDTAGTAGRRDEPRVYLEIAY